MKIIQISGTKRQKSYEWFSSFSNPTYALSARLDVTPLIALKEECGRKFFDDMLYLVTSGLNSVEALRQRLKDGKVVEYDCPDPSFTVALEDGCFDICRVKWQNDPAKFTADVRAHINAAKKAGGNKRFGDSGVDVYYYTCLPWLDFTSMTNPIPDDPEIAAIPRICWGKYVKEGLKYTLCLSVQVSHALVDGKPLSDAFEAIRQRIDGCKKILL